jgi:hypothetical protein
MSGNATNQDLSEIGGKSLSVKDLKNSSVTFREVSFGNSAYTNCCGATFAIAAVERSPNYPHIPH